MKQILLLESKKIKMPPQASKTAVVAIGRFQGVSKGHLKIINAAKKAFREYGYDKIVICIIAGEKSSKDKKKNPLSPAQRKFFLENAIGATGIKFIVASNAFEALIKCRKEGFEPMCVVGGKFSGGEDRASGYKEILDKYFKTPDGDKIHHRMISITRDKHSKSDKGISATAIRVAALNDKYEDYLDMVPFESKAVANKMWHAIKNGMKVKNDQQ